MRTKKISFHDINLKIKITLQYFIINKRIYSYSLDTVPLNLSLLDTLTSHSKKKRKVAFVSLLVEGKE